MIAPEIETEINAFLATLAQEERFAPENVQKFIELEADVKRLLKVYRQPPQHYADKIPALECLQEKLIGAVIDLLGDHFQYLEIFVEKAEIKVEIKSIETFIDGYLKSIIIKNHPT